MQTYTTDMVHFWSGKICAKGSSSLVPQHMFRWRSHGEEDDAVM